ncbi:MAG TPA: cysteine peptidase family C39 domain-containing protein [Phycisphaerales bacterium]|nr:cysteine peptidase family C39 domain-containing protein [Phycisphaerales bacterium]HMP37804.1 cysteine peptidase family C39 domain-containing protein [Phycisphaerales bacterium]
MGLRPISSAVLVACGPCMMSAGALGASAAPSAVRTDPCGAACVAIVLRLFERPVREFELRALADSSGAMSMAEMQRYFRARGIAAEARVMSLEDLGKWEGAAVVHLGLQGDDAPHAGHFAVYIPCPQRTGPGEFLDATIPVVRGGSLDPDFVRKHWTGNVLLVGEPARNLWPAVVIVAAGALGIAAGVRVRQRRR